MPEYRALLPDRPIPPSAEFDTNVEALEWASTLLTRKAVGVAVEKRTSTDPTVSQWEYVGHVGRTQKAE